MHVKRKNFIDHTGEENEYIKLLEFAGYVEWKSPERKSGIQKRSRYLTLCKRCGEKFLISYNDFKKRNGENLRIKSCGCLRKGRPRDPNKDYSDIPEDLRNNPEYREWRKKVFERDNGTCQNIQCGSTRNPEAHHILNFADYPEERTNVKNGIILCKICHANYHKRFGKRFTKEHELRWFFTFPLVDQLDTDMIEPFEPEGFEFDTAPNDIFDTPKGVINL